MPTHAVTANIDAVRFSRVDKRTQDIGLRAECCIPNTSTHDRGGEFLT